MKAGGSAIRNLTAELLLPQGQQDQLGAPKNKKSLLLEPVGRVGLCKYRGFCNYVLGIEFCNPGGGSKYEVNITLLSGTTLGV